MSFIASIFEAIVDVIVFIVEAVVQIVEMVVHLIMVLLGWDSGSSQVIEYYEVHNIPLFDDVDKKNPLLNSVLQSVIENQDITGNLIYHLAFRSLKGNVKDFMDFIDNGNYFENFPTVESYILTIDYTELTATLNTINGVPCTPEGSYLRALSKVDWAKYWLQENAGYNVGTNTIGVDHSTTSTSPITPAADTVTVTPSLNHFDIDITSEIATEDEVFADERWEANLNNIVYNSGPDTYTIPVYNAATVGNITRNYTAPTKPTQLHYVSFYYRDSAPSRQYLFIYQVGAGTYTDLDTVENAIDQDGSSIEALPCIPLRLSNADYTTFGVTKKTQIEDLLDIILLDAEQILDTVVTESGVASGDLDHIYVNFGVRMWDTSQTGMGYLFTMFENLYPSQGVTQGTYNNSPTGDDKPQNNILITTDDNKLAYQWSYITFTHTSLAAIDADSGSVENGIYYSDMSKFVGGILKYNYYVSSGKGTYNVGYKADDLDEVQDFLDGSGVPNPGTTSGEATNWLQVTERMSYNNPSPVLQEADGSTSDLKYLTPDLVYENNGSGGLRLVESASDATTVGQSITYYCVKPSGLDAYTVVAPIASCRVVDGSSGHFRVVKFNLGNKGDLMVPFIHNFIKDLSNDKVSRLFLAGCHCSIYIAHYEKIVHEGMDWLTALVMIVIIVVIIVVAWPMIVEGFAAMGAAFAELAAAAAAGTFLTTAWGMFMAALPNIIIKMAAQYIIQVAIAEIAGDNEELAMILNLVAMVAVSTWEPGISYGSPTYGTTGGTAIGPSTPGGSIEFASPSLSFSGSSFDFSGLGNPLKLVSLALDVINGLNRISMRKEAQIAADLRQERTQWMTGAGEQDAHLSLLEDAIAPTESFTQNVMLQSLRNVNRGAALGGEVTYALFTAQYDVPYLAYAYSETIQQSVSGQVAI